VIEETVVNYNPSFLMGEKLWGLFIVSSPYTRSSNLIKRPVMVMIVRVPNNRKGTTIDNLKNILSI